jgi:hypothetical protein
MELLGVQLCSFCGSREVGQREPSRVELDDHGGGLADQWADESGVAIGCRFRSSCCGGGRGGQQGRPSDEGRCSIGSWGELLGCE